MSGLPGANCSGNTADNTTYGGPDAYFTNIDTSTYGSGTVHFISPITTGRSTFFSLETALGSGTVTGAGPQTATVQVNPVGGVTLTALFGGKDPSACNPCSSTPIVGVNGIVPATGALVESVQDMFVPGAGVPLVLSQTYDSGLAQLQVSSSTAPGPLGYGWSYNLGMGLAVQRLARRGHGEPGERQRGQLLALRGRLFAELVHGRHQLLRQCPRRSLATLEQNADGSWTFVRVRRRAARRRSTSPPPAPWCPRPTRRAVR